MTGKETVNYLRGRYRRGRDYAEIRVIADQRTIQVDAPNPEMQVELEEMCFEIDSRRATKIWPELEPRHPGLWINTFSGLIYLGVTVIDNGGKWNKDTKEYEIPEDYKIPEHASSPRR